MNDRDALIRTIRWQQAGFAASGCPFYVHLADELIADVSGGGRVWDLLQPVAAAPVEDAYVLRFLGGVHRFALSGDAPELARHFPSTGGDGDAAAAAAALSDVLADPPAILTDALRRPPQTNEVGRAAALASGVLVVAQQTQLPIRLREIGSSAGLNLRLDSYWYEQGGTGWGNARSPVRFVDLWNGGAPPFDYAGEIIERRGCDRDPIDIGTDDGAHAVLSYVWPQPADRFTRARDAITIARTTDADVDRADVVEWLDTHLAPHPETALVVCHSVVWQYLDEPTRAAVREKIGAAGARATRDAPVAWLRLEPTPETYVPAELRLTVWTGTKRDGDERFLATTGFHGGPITWLDAASPSPPPPA